MKNALIFGALIGIVALFACNKAEKQAKEDRRLILADLAAKGLTATEDPSGIFSVIDIKGNFEHPNINSLVTVAYKGTLLNGTVFDSSNSAQFGLSQVIQGWQVAVPLLGKSGHGTFWIPSALAYGTAAQAGIPANSVLIFEITLKDFQ